MMGAVGQRRARPPPLGAGARSGSRCRREARCARTSPSITGPVAPLVRGPREEDLRDGVGEGDATAPRCPRPASRCAAASRGGRCTRQRPGAEPALDHVAARASRDRSARRRPRPPGRGASCRPARRAPPRAGCGASATTTRVGRPIAPSRRRSAARRTMGAWCQLWTVWSTHPTPATSSATTTELVGRPHQRLLAEHVQAALERGLGSGARGSTAACRCRRSRAASSARSDSTESNQRASGSALGARPRAGRRAVA